MIGKHLRCKVTKNRAPPKTRLHLFRYSRTAVFRHPPHPLRATQQSVNRKRLKEKVNCARSQKLITSDRFV